MLKNMGSLDKVLRIILAIVVLALFVLKLISGVAAIILGAIAVIFIITSLLGYCPLYQLFGFSTKGK